jgi:hypothetical protein
MAAVPEADVEQSAQRGRVGNRRGVPNPCPNAPKPLAFAKRSEAPNRSSKATLRHCGTTGANVPPTSGASVTSA